MKPTFIGLGAQKAASSWIYAVLKDHPQICVSEPKELDFFSRFYEYGFQWYEGFFNHCRGCDVAGEVSPSYFDSAEGPLRAARYNSAFRIIVSLRDPVARAFSNHLHEIREKRLTGRDLSFETGLANNPMYLERCRYATHLQRWFDAFDQRQILVLFKEEIDRAPREHADALYGHLGLEDRYCSPFADSQVNRSYVPRSQARETLVRGIGSVMRRFGGPHFVERVKRIGAIREFRMANRIDVRELVPPMTLKTRAWFEEELAEEMLKLARMLNREALPWETWRRLVNRPRNPETILPCPNASRASPLARG